MLPESYVPLISALAGALIGSFASIFTVMIQARKDERKQRRDLTFQTATKVWQEHLQIAKEHGAAIHPIEIYLWHTKRLVDAVETGSLTVKDLEKVDEELEELKEFAGRKSKPSPPQK